MKFFNNFKTQKQYSIKILISLGILSTLTTNSNAVLNSKYYLGKQNVYQDESNWQGRIYNKVSDIEYSTMRINGQEYREKNVCADIRHVCGTTNVITSKNPNQTRSSSNCFNKTLDAGHGIYTDQMIYFAYDDATKSDKGRGCSLDSNKKGKFLHNPIPVLVAGGNSDSQWSAAWDGYLRIPWNGEWDISLVSLGDGYLQLCGYSSRTNDYTDCKNKYFGTGTNSRIHTADQAIRESQQQDKQIRLTKAGSYKIKVRYASYIKGKTIIIQWIDRRDTGGTPTSGHNKAFLISSDKLAPMKPIPSIFFDTNPPQPPANIEYKVVEKDFVTNYNGDFDWLFNSPLRTKTAGKNNQYCVIMGIKENNKYKQINESRDVYIGFDLTESKIPPNSNTTKRIEMNRGNKLKVNSQNINSACFDAPTDKMITKSGHFSLYDTQAKLYDTNIAGEKLGNDFSIKPGGYKIIFMEKDTSNAISQTGNKVTLTAGKIYEVKISAQIAGNNNALSDIPGIATAAKYETIIKNTKLVHIDENLTCHNKNDVNLGNPIKTQSGNYALVFRDNVVKFKTGDITSDLVTPANKLYTPYFYNLVNNTYSQYIDVMKFKTQIEDTEWTAVNFSDIKNYNSLSNEEKARVRNQVQKYGYQCRGHKINGVSVSTAFDNSLEDCDINLVSPRFVEFVPAGFEIDISDTNTINGASGFTYINDIKSNDITSPSTTLKTHDMLAKLKLKIKALGSGNSINNQWLSNFSNNCYATDVNVTISYNGDKYIKDPSSVDSITDINLKNNLKNYLQAKKLFAFGDDINASKRMSFDENSSYKTSPYAVISFNKLNSGYKSSSYNARSATYSDFDNSSLVNKAHYTISKNAFSIHERQMNTTSNVEHNRYTTGVNIGFNFTRSKDKADNPFIIAPIEFDIEPITYKSRPITTNVIKGTYTANYEPTKVATMLYGRVYAPFYEGPKSGFIEKIYYGYYDSKGCATTSRLQGISGDYLPQISNYCVNLKHDNPAYGYWQNYSSNNNTSMTRVNPMSGSTGSFTKITNPSNPSQVISVSELVRFSNTKATRDEIRLYMPKYPWLIFNDSGLDYNSFPIQFHDEVNFNDWGGKAYDKSGNETGVGNFIFDNDKVPVRTNRRIDW